MSTAPRKHPEPESEYEGIVRRTVNAYLTAQQAAAELADGMAGYTDSSFHRVMAAEKELDRLDREIDVSVSTAISQVNPAQARELLSSMKMAIDLERIGDLLASVATCASALGSRLSTDDVADLVKMASMIEKMIADAHGSFTVRNVDRAIAVLRMDSEIDRLRNLLMIRHFEQAQIRMPQDSIQILFMAQALERAGDHVKNLAEEVCHLVTGHTVRHVLRHAKKADEQMDIEWLRHRHGLAAEPNEPPGREVPLLAE
jgi:phosphate transport system protein